MVNVTNGRDTLAAAAATREPTQSTRKTMTKTARRISSFRDERELRDSDLEDNTSSNLSIGADELEDFHIGDTSSCTSSEFVIRESSRPDDDDDGAAAAGPAENKIDIANSENQAVINSKILAYLVLATFALFVSALAAHFVTKAEKKEFETQFNLVGNMLIQGANDRVITITGQMQTLSTSITSAILMKEEELLTNEEQGNSTHDAPFVVLPHFRSRTEQLRFLLGADMILYAPLVSRDRLHEWESFILNEKENIVKQTFGPVDARNKEIDAEKIHLTIQSVPPESYRNSSYQELPQHAWLPILQYGPFFDSSELVNLDLLSHPVIQHGVQDSFKTLRSVILEARDEELSFLPLDTGGKTSSDGNSGPKSLFLKPVFSSLDEEPDDRTIVGFVVAVEPWVEYFANVLSNGVEGEVIVTVNNSCGHGLMTFDVRDRHAEFRGYADLHDRNYHDLRIQALLDHGGTNNGTHLNCEYALAVYPSKSFEDAFRTSAPYLYGNMVFGIFLITAIVFALYDWTVRRFQKKVLQTATRSAQIVHSLFPKAVGDRLLAEVEQTESEKNNKKKRANKLSAYLIENSGTLGDKDPIADFYPDATVLFADLVGFTAWSSAREPKQVFMLLETIYADFDSIANRHRVFKVETVGDCYVACAGLPEPRQDHAPALARFARDINYRFRIVINQLEVTLGPETSDLAIRVGLHSGPVTAGVLRGDRARFQLFGDTMNTASRMESTGKPGKIQLSQETAALLRSAGKEQWLIPREELVTAKGKGQLRTFWLRLKNGTIGSGASGSTGNGKLSSSDIREAQVETNQAKNTNSDEKDKILVDRLVRWNAEILGQKLKQICAKRVVDSQLGLSSEHDGQTIDMRKLEQEVLSRNTTPLNEATDTIRLPDYQSSDSNIDSVELHPGVKDQLYHFVATTAAMYRKNYFHNFEHASHVTMSVVKLMARIASPINIAADASKGDSKHIDSSQHDLTYGIKLDPLTQFSCALSAMIHDVDHSGVPNSTLAKEKAAIALAYGGKSIAEQNSVDLAWSLLMQEQYRDLRRAIYSTESEFKRFRQLVVNCVMATDIMDKDLGERRKERWVKAFSERRDQESECVHYRATVILEHLMQASDVAHTMQHWHVFKKWNHRLFLEMYQAFRNGHSDQDPSECWYQGETRFFAHYIIPLARKLKECGVFGVSSDEYLNYALQNAKEWQLKGQEIVAEFKEAARSEFKDMPEKDTKPLQRQQQQPVVGPVFAPGFPIENYAATSK